MSINCEFCESHPSKWYIQSKKITRNGRDVPIPENGFEQFLKPNEIPVIGWTNVCEQCKEYFLMINAVRAKKPLDSK